MGIKQALVRMRQEASQLLMRLLVSILALFVSSALTAYMIGQAEQVAMPSYLWLHWSFGTIAGLIATVWSVMSAISKRWHAGFMRALKSGNFWYWLITGCVFYFALAWVITHWPPEGVSGWLSWLGALIPCLLSVLAWLWTLMVQALTKDEREFHHWLDHEESPVSPLATRLQEADERDAEM